MKGWEIWWKKRGYEEGLEILYPSRILCTDNAAMIGSAAYFNYIKGYVSDLYLNVVPNLELKDNYQQYSHIIFTNWHGYTKKSLWIMWKYLSKPLKLGQVYVDNLVDSVNKMGGIKWEN